MFKILIVLLAMVGCFSLCATFHVNLILTGVACVIAGVGTFRAIE